MFNQHPIGGMTEIESIGVDFLKMIPEHGRDEKGSKIFRL